MPNGAEFRTARNPERRGIPKSAKSQTAKTARAPFRSLRRSGFRAVRDRRRSEFSGVWNLALFGIWRRLSVRAVWDCALFAVAPFKRCSAA
jgi:hypothetical protein